MVEGDSFLPNVHPRVSGHFVFERSFNVAKTLNFTLVTVKCMLTSIISNFGLHNNNTVNMQQMMVSKTLVSWLLLTLLMVSQYQTMVSRLLLTLLMVSQYRTMVSRLLLTLLMVSRYRTMVSRLLLTLIMRR